jgi:hypothetical protein
MVYKEYIKHVYDNLCPVIAAATLPLYLLHNDRIHRGHSGVFLRAGQFHLLLTASHDYRSYLQNRVPMFVGWDERERVPVFLDRNDFFLADEDSLDCGFIILQPEQVQALRPRYKPISISQLIGRDDADNSLYVMCGYPQAWMHMSSEDELTSTPLFYSCQKYGKPRADDPLDSFRFDPRSHVLFNVEKEGVHGTDWTTVQLPSLDGMKGISGCGIWKVGAIQDRKLVRYQADSIALCAIEHRYNENDGYVMATWVEQLIGGILLRLPELKPVFNLYPNRR